MRNVILNHPRINISDDRDRLISDLIEFALSSIYMNQVEEMFAPDGDGLTVANIIPMPTIFATNRLSVWAHRMCP